MGIKLSVLVDSNGYIVDFQIYAGKAKNITGKGLSLDAVVLLYHIYHDNFYMGIALHLFDLGFGACGTYGEARVRTPTTKEDALARCSPRGSIQ